MHIKKNKQLETLATAANKTTEAVSKIITEELIRRNIVYDVYDFWGYAFKDVYDSDLKVKEVLDVIHAIGIKTIRCEHLDAFMDLILMGDYDCPECGGEMKVEDGEYKDVFTDMLTEPYVNIIFEEKICKVCGHREIKGQEE